MDVEDYEDLPKSLVKDINLMKVFNGNYRSANETIGDDDEGFTIRYDGNAWEFSTVYISCFFGRPTDYKELLITEDETVRAMPFLQTLDCCIQSDHHMQLRVKDVCRDWGVLAINVWDNEGKHFLKSEIKVEVASKFTSDCWKNEETKKADLSRVLFHNHHHTGDANECEADDYKQEFFNETHVSVEKVVNAYLQEVYDSDEDGENLIERVRAKRKRECESYSLEQMKIRKNL